MFNPVVIPIPAALAAVALLVALTVAWAQWADTGALPWGPKPKPVPAPAPPRPRPGQHRLERIIERGDVPGRDWAAIAAERMLNEHRAAYAPRTALVPMMEIAGHDDHPTAVADVDIALDDTTRELEAVK